MADPVFTVVPGFGPVTGGTPVAISADQDVFPVDGVTVFWVIFGGISVVPTILDARHVTCVSPPHAVGAVDLMLVVNPPAGSNALDFAVDAPIG